MSQKVFNFPNRYSPYCDGEGNFLLISKEHAPLRICQIGPSGNLTQINRTCDSNLLLNYIMNEIPQFGNRVNSFLICYSNLQDGLPSYELIKSDDICDKIPIFPDYGISRFRLSPDGRFFVYCAQKSSLCTIFYYCDLHNTKSPLWVKQVNEPFWDFSIDIHNDLYIATENRVVKFLGDSGKIVWTIPINLEKTSTTSCVSLNVITSFIVLSFFRCNTLQLCGIIADIKTGKYKPLVPYQIENNCFPYIPNFVPANYSFDLLWRIVTSKRGTEILKLNLQNEEWNKVATSSIKYPSKFYACSNDRFFIVGTTDNPKLEKVTAEAKSVLFTHKELKDFDCVISPKDELGIYTQKRNSSQFWKMKI